MNQIRLSLIALAPMLSANTIPLYPIQSIQETTITFSNLASFTATYHFSFKEGDLLELVSFVDPNSFPIHVEQTRGQYVVSPLLLLRKAATNEEAIVYFVPSTILADSNTPSILSIDLTHRTITLNDGSQWAYPEEESFFVKSWRKNQLLMIGKGGAPYEAILFNTETRQAIRANSTVFSMAE